LSEALHAFRDFVVGVAKRFYAFLPAILLDPFDIYQRLKPETWPDYDMPDWMAWTAFGFALFWAVFATFFEVWRSTANSSRASDFPVHLAAKYLQEKLRVGALEAYDILEDGASTGALSVWARKSGGNYKPPLQSLSIDLWKDYGLNASPYSGHENGVPLSGHWVSIRAPSGAGEIYNDVRFNRREVAVLSRQVKQQYLGVAYTFMEEDKPNIKQRVTQLLKAMAHRKPASQSLAKKISSINSGVSPYPRCSPAR
jgi:hypothetical protein